MRRPAAHRATAVTLALAGAGLSVSSLSESGIDVRGVVVFVAALSYLITAQMQVARLRRLRAGEGVLGRWTVDGVEVIISESSTVVDGDIKPMPLTGGARVTSVWFVDGGEPHLQFDI